MANPGERGRAVSFTASASELWLAAFKDPDGNNLALMSEVAVAGD